MATLTRAHLIKIGNSQGIRIPKLLLEQAGIVGEVELEATSGQLVIRPAPSTRQGWDDLFQAMAEAGDDRLLNGEALSLTEWESSEWEW